MKLVLIEMIYTIKMYLHDDIIIKLNESARILVIRAAFMEFLTLAKEAYTPIYDWHCQFTIGINLT